MIYPYIIIDDNEDHIFETRSLADGFAGLKFAGSASSYDEGLDLILEIQPAVVFLEIDPDDLESRLSLHIINDAFRYLAKQPKFVVTTKNRDLAFDAMKYEVFDYLLKPLHKSEFRKTFLKLTRNTEAMAPVLNLPIILEEPKPVQTEIKTKSHPVSQPTEDVDSDVEILNDSPTIAEIATGVKEKPLIICVKSYGDYRFINADDICYLQADNNSTDIHLNNGEMVTAFKTLKHFENVLQTPFVRIHNSYIVNIDYVSRIHTGNSVCYIRNTTTKLPFSKSYKDNIDAILTSITKGNYLEI